MLGNRKINIKKGLIAIPLFIFIGYLSLVVHELGHSLVYYSYNMKIKQIVVFPGFEIYPEFGKKIFYKKIVNGSVQLEDSYYPESIAKNGLALFMGSGITAIIALLASIFLWVFNPKRIMALVLLFITLWVFDILAYSFNKSYRGPEPINGLVMMGFSSLMAYLIVITISLTTIISASIFVKRNLLARRILINKDTA